MKRLIGFLISGCWHHWEVINAEDLRYSNDFGSGTCVRYTLQCKHCGDIKTKKAK